MNNTGFMESVLYNITYTYVRAAQLYNLRSSSVSLSSNFCLLLLSHLQQQTNDNKKITKPKNVTATFSYLYKTAASLSSHGLIYVDQEIIHTKMKPCSKQLCYLRVYDKLLPLAKE